MVFSKITRQSVLVASKSYLIVLARSIKEDAKFHLVAFCMCFCLCVRDINENIRIIAETGFPLTSHH